MLAERKEKYTNVGFLLVLTGASGSGKDSVMSDLLKHQIMSDLHIKRVVSCTDRPPRDYETQDVDYHFVTSEQLDQMDQDGKLAESIVDTGTSRKATPMSEIERLFSGEHLIWRIDPSLAVKIATGNFFEKQFQEEGAILRQHTLVVCLNASKEVIESRRKRRDKDKYDPEEYILRDSQESSHLGVLLENSIVIENTDDMLEQAVNIIVNITREHHDKIKGKVI